jgi:hypothetical protein
MTLDLILPGAMETALTIPAVWRPVVGYEGVYEVSSEGAIRRIGRAKSVRVGRILKWQRHTWGGYPAVYLSKKCEKARPYVHVLVAEAFICPRPKGKEVNHIDGNRWNPRASNLEWVTRAENVAHMQRIGNARYAVGEAASHAKLTETQVREIRAADGTLRAIAQRFGVHHTTVLSIRTRECWRHVKEDGLR